MKTYSSELTAEKAKSAVTHFWLLKVGSVCFTDCDTAISYGGDTYNPWAFSFDGISVSDEGVLNGLRISVSNLPKPSDTTPPLSAYVLDNTWKDAVVTLYQAWYSSAMAQVTGGADLVFEGRVSGRPSLSEEWAVLQVQPLRNPWSRKVGQRRVSGACGWVFKDASTCQYAGGETTCDKSYTRCTALSNTANFGGFRFWAESYSVTWKNNLIKWEVQED